MPRHFNRERVVFSKNGVGELRIHLREKRNEPQHLPKLQVDHRCKSSNYKTSRRQLGRKLSRPWVKQGFLQIPNPCTMKGKKFIGLHQILKCSSKDAILKNEKISHGQD